MAVCPVWARRVVLLPLGPLRWGCEVSGARREPSVTAASGAGRLYRLFERTLLDISLMRFAFWSSRQRSHSLRVDACDASWMEWCLRGDALRRCSSSRRRHVSFFPTRERLFPCHFGGPGGDGRTPRRPRAHHFGGSCETRAPATACRVVHFGGRQRD